ncbi:hypothetical protein KI387_002813, partial [Taxus chinensis]
MASGNTHCADMHEVPEVIDPPSPNPVEHDVGEVKNSIRLTVKSNISAASSVHELLECPVCTNSMYPPILQ